MRKPRVTTWIIIGQSIALLACLGVLGVTLWHNYFLKYYAKAYAAQAGYADARYCFQRQEFCLYEVKPYHYDVDRSGPVPTDGTSEPSGRMDGPFQVWSFWVDNAFPGPHAEIQQAYVDAHNLQMRRFFEHPEWFDKNGNRLPTRELKASNSPAK